MILPACVGCWCPGVLTAASLARGTTAFPRPRPRPRGAATTAGGAALGGSTAGAAGATARAATGLAASGSFSTGPIVFLTPGMICTTRWVVNSPWLSAGAILMGEPTTLGGGTREMVMGAGFGAIGFGCIPSLTMTTFTGDDVPAEYKIMLHVDFNTLEFQYYPSLAKEGAQLWSLLWLATLILRPVSQRALLSVWFPAPFLWSEFLRGLGPL